jgi:NADH dehydrogenase subunit 5 C-terminus.
MVETSYNIMFGMVGLLVMSIFGGSSLMWLTCPTPSVICLPYYLIFLTLLVIILVQITLPHIRKDISTEQSVRYFSIW